jgi:hypothetical protein
MKVETLRKIAREYREELERRRAANLKFMEGWHAGHLSDVWKYLKQEPRFSKLWLHYFIRARGLGDIKIGKTNSLNSRFNALLTSCSRGADLIACYPDHIGHEQELHADFYHAHLHGEWFRECDELTTYLEAIGVNPRGLTNLPPMPFQRRHPAKLMEAAND